MSMTEEAMEAEASAYWSTHEPAGSAAKAVSGTPAATFTVGNFLFDNGGAGQVDTAQIVVGESVLWQWIAGTHTITSGTGSSDPNEGTLFNQPSDLTHQQFTFTFNSEGTFPFFCVFHELSNMKGVVIVSATNDVPAPGAGALGFTMDPAPNPTTSGLRFDYALPAAGHARADVFDAGGRRVAVLVNADLPAGVHAVSWDGRTGHDLAGPGVYYVRLRLPGYEETRRVVIRR
jgi:plastocyanin